MQEGCRHHELNRNWDQPFHRERQWAATENPCREEGSRCPGCECAQGWDGHNTANTIRVWTQQDLGAGMSRRGQIHCVSRPSVSSGFKKAQEEQINYAGYNPKSVRSKALVKT